MTAPACSMCAPPSLHTHGVAACISTRCKHGACTHAERERGGGRTQTRVCTVGTLHWAPCARVACSPGAAPACTLHAWHLRSQCTPSRCISNASLTLKLAGQRAFTPSDNCNGFVRAELQWTPKIMPPPLSLLSLACALRSSCQFWLSRKKRSWTVYGYD